MQRRYGPCVVLMAVALVLTGCGRTRVTGVYAASTETRAGLLQLVENDQGDISGRVETVQLKPDGSIADYNASVTGVADGKIISLSLKPTWVAAIGNVEATAVVEGDRLSLAVAGIPPSGRYYHKSDLSDFEQHASALRERSAKLLAQQAAVADTERQRETDAELSARQSQAIAAQAANQRAATINVASAASGLVVRLDAFNARLDRVMARVPIVEQGFRRLAAVPDGPAKSTGLRNWVEQGVRSLQQDEVAFEPEISAVEAACAGETVNHPEPGASTAQLACEAIIPKLYQYRTKSRATFLMSRKLVTMDQSSSGG